MDLNYYPYESTKFVLLAKTRRSSSVDAARSASFAADKNEGPQRGSGRPIPPLVSKIQVTTTNAGARAQGGLTPDLLTLSDPGQLVRQESGVTPRNLLLSTCCSNGGLFDSGWSGGRPARRIATRRATTNKLVTKPATPAHPCRAQNHPPAVPSTLDPRW